MKGNRLVKFLRWLMDRIEQWLDARWCDTCGTRLVRYKDGSFDCPHLIENVRREKGGLA